MCGIVGTHGVPIERGAAIVAVINEKQRLRGPDASAVISLEPMVAMGATRLAIQGVGAQGDQPLHSPNGHLTAVYNGEIYNGRELVEAYGLEPKGSNDGAVILALWEVLGWRCLGQFRGMFALLIHDNRDGSLWAVRDALGVKPLWCLRDTGSLVFASDARALWEVHDGSTAVDPAAIGEFFQFGSFRELQGPTPKIEAVPAGTALRIGVDGREETYRWFSPWPECHNDFSPRAVLQEIEDSARAHLRSDVPVALLLSGGVDSSLLARSYKNGQELQAFTVDGAGMDQEGPPARRTAQAFGLEHRIVAPAVDDDLLHGYFRAMSRPTIDGLNTFFVCRAISAAGLRVAVTGLGGDELFHGYRYAMALPAIARVEGATAITHRLPLRAKSTVTLVQESRRLMSREWASRLVGLDVPHAPLPKARGRPGFIAAEEQEYLRRVLLPDSDVFSMACSVEMRVPFIDVRVRDAAHGMPLFAGGRYGKHRLRPALPAVERPLIFSGRKRGFVLPVAQWLEDPSSNLRARLDAAMHPNAPLWSAIDADVFHRVKRDGDYRLQWAAVVLNEWLRESRARSQADVTSR